MSDRSEATPLPERLRSVPRDERLIFSPPGASPEIKIGVPIGEYVHEAASEIELLRERVAELEAQAAGPHPSRECFDALRDGLNKAATQFGFYQQQHLQKRPPDEAKAKTNLRWLMFCLDRSLGIRTPAPGFDPRTDLVSAASPKPEAPRWTKAKDDLLREMVEWMGHTAPRHLIEKSLAPFIAAAWPSRIKPSPCPIPREPGLEGSKCHWPDCRCDQP